MMYHEKLAAAIRVDGQVLKEFKETVYVPYGAQYEVRLKNLNTIRAIVSIKIDGNDVTGTGLVINPGETVDLERSIANGNLKQGNKFKFIQRTEQIEQHRGVQLEDGLVIIEYQFEKVMPRPTYTPRPYWAQPHYLPVWYDDNYVTSSMSATDNIGVSASSDMVYTSQTAMRSIKGPAATVGAAIQSFGETVDVGITVPGAVSDQSFVVVQDFAREEQKYSMVFKLVGATGQQTVTKAVTVKTKPKCTSCGHHNRVTNKFCSSCGTGLIIV